VFAWTSRNGVPNGCGWSKRTQAERDAALSQLCLKQCALAYDTYLKTAKPEGNTYRTAALVRGEIYRRLGDFKPAREWFDNLAKQKAFAAEHYPAMIARQLKLIASKDAEPRNFEQPEEK
jgi:hypothetical protein